MVVLVIREQTFNLELPTSVDLASDVSEETELTAQTAPSVPVEQAISKVL